MRNATSIHTCSSANRNGCNSNWLLLCYSLRKLDAKKQLPKTDNTDFPITSTKSLVLQLYLTVTEETLKRFENGEWTVSYRGKPYHNQAINDAYETQINRGLKPSAFRTIHLANFMAYLNPGIETIVSTEGTYTMYLRLPGLSPLAVSVMPHISRFLSVCTYLSRLE